MGRNNREKKQEENWTILQSCPFYCATLLLFSLHTRNAPHSHKVCSYFKGKANNDRTAAALPTACSQHITTILYRLLF